MGEHIHRINADGDCILCGASMNEIAPEHVDAPIHCEHRRPIERCPHCNGWRSGGTIIPGGIVPTELRATPDPLREKLAELCEMWECDYGEPSIYRNTRRECARELRELLK